MSIFKDENGKEFVSPYTPVIWKVIFTGKTPRKMSEAKPPERWRNPLLNWLRSIWFVRSIYAGLIELGIVRAGLLSRLGFKRKPLAEPYETFLQMAEKPVIVHNPLTSDVKWVAKPLNRKFKPKEIVEDRLKVFMKEIQETFSKLDGDWDLFVVYTKLLDVVGHLYWHAPLVIEKYYRMVDEFARQVQNRLHKNMIMVIVSDHVMRPLHGALVGGEHSHHAFVSFNQKIKVPKPLKITDIYKIIISILRRE